MVLGRGISYNLIRISTFMNRDLGGPQPHCAPSLFHGGLSHVEPSSIMGPTMYHAYITRWGNLHIHRCAEIGGQWAADCGLWCALEILSHRLTLWPSLFVHCFFAPPSRHHSAENTANGTMHRHKNHRLVDLDHCIKCH